MRIRTVAFIAVWLVTVGPVGANELSKRLTARGLVQFHDQHYTEALPLFDEAVHADGGDVYARYYRGVTYGWLGNNDAAIDDLYAVALKRPDIEQVNIELGVVLFQKGAYEDALPWLVAAQEIPTTEAKASLFLGLTQFRLKHPAEARAAFERAATRDPSLHDAAQYYLGVADFNNGDYTAAETHFRAVVDANPESEIGHEAAKFLASVDRIRSRYEAYGSLGFQYDSNVILAPNGAAVKDALNISNQADGRTTIDAGARYVAWETDQARLTVGYEFYQSLHFKLEDFNLQDHRPTADFNFRRGPLSFNFLGAYDYYLLKDDSFLQEVLAAPTIAYSEPEFGLTEVGYRVRHRNFYQQPYKDTRDALNQEVSIRQVVYLGSSTRYFAIGYRFDHDDPSYLDGKPFEYDGNEVNGTFGWLLPFDVLFEGGYARRFENFAPQSDGRIDNEHIIAGVFRRDINQYLRVIAGYFGTINHSTDERFAYDRHIGSVALEGRFWQ